MCTAKPKAPAPVVVPVAPTPAATQAAATAALVTTPTAQDAAVEQARDETRQRAIRSTQENNTLVTGGQGLLDQTAPTQGKQLFGV